MGEGGQAQIREVHDSSEEFPGTYALKALSKNKPQKAYERFYREISVLKQLNHPYIIKIVDSSTEGNMDSPFYVMEYLKESKTLQKVIESDDNPFYCNPLAALELFRMICEVISVCESADPPIIHRDLSLSNILWLPDKTIRIIDFGLCQSTKDETITLVDEGVGTINYMAPECEAGSGGNIGIWSDLYSAGKILWSVITGQKAFSREKVCFNSKSLREIFPETPLAWHLYHIFSKTIRHNPVDRWKDAKSALAGCQTAKNLILNGYPPIEKIASNCPTCGVGKLKDFQGSHMVFGNPNPEGIHGRQCDYCGICLAINYKKLDENIDRMKTLE